MWPQHLITSIITARRLRTSQVFPKIHQQFLWKFYKHSWSKGNQYGIGTVATTSKDMYSFGIHLQEMFTGKRPTDDMFKDSLTLHHFTKIALPDQVLEVVDPLLLAGDNEEENACSSRNPRRANMEETKKKEYLISILGVGIACSVESLKDRMDSVNASKLLHSIRDKFLGTGIRTQRNTYLEWSLVILCCSQKHYYLFFSVKLPEF
ncbi:putative receptor-like protein kinase At3g47110 isoform X6 [Durio zibethinus]|uniref:Receptor-like protein kinase At3g47110 isoform X6 n=1 Tax=Durio zibethinus TaxID=66656 RepID=A0A6P5XVV0_DURZI|nr:putative receptor-like protein kinase At3g47110 isoform X6 [Durio zibethinus]